MNALSNKKSETLVFKNEFNEVRLRDFNACELDLLFAIMSLMRNRGLDEVDLSFDRLKILSKYNKENALSSFVSDLKSTYDKLIGLNVTIGDSRKFTKFVFFTKYTIDLDLQTVTIGVNKEFKHLINKLTGSFTKLELDEITSLKSTYSKNCYRLLKQYRGTGYLTLSIEDFRELLDVPESYSMGNINQRVLKPILNELPQYFYHLKIDKIKGTGKDSRKIVRLNFSFWNDDSIKKGKRVFRRSDGSFYEKEIFDFDAEEIKKVYPESPEDKIFTKNS